MVQAHGKPAPGPIDYTGSKRGETVVGTDFNDHIDGAGGNDTIHGQGGDDRLLGGTGDDWLYGGAGNDTAYGGDGNDFLLGDAGNDVLLGEAGNDRFLGGLGADVMTGGAGTDVFSVNYLGDSNAAGGIDLITDLNPAEGDMIRLFPVEQSNGWTLVDSASGSANEATVTWVDDGSFDGQGYTSIDCYLADGDTTADMTIHVVGQVSDLGALWGLMI